MLSTSTFDDVVISGKVSTLKLNRNKNRLHVSLAFRYSTRSLTNYKNVFNIVNFDISETYLNSESSLKCLEIFLFTQYIYYCILYIHEALGDARPWATAPFALTAL